TAVPQVRAAAADGIDVKAPVLLLVEPDSLCWLSGRRTDTATGAAWAQALAPLPHRDEVLRDGGTAPEKGVARVHGPRHDDGRALLTDPGDHGHARRHGGAGLNKAQRQARQALAAAEVAQQQRDACARQGQSRTAAAARARHAGRRAEQAL